MNIEEERKAFKQYTALDSNVYNDEFGFWLKAKQHAADMAKPVVVCTETLNEKWGLYLPSHHRALEVKDSREDAEAWAKDNGYRVVTE